MLLLQERIIQARMEARQLHRRFGVESVSHVNVYGFAERLRVQLVDARIRGALAQLIANERRTRILLSTRLVDPSMRRVAVAHELGHYLLRHPTPSLDEPDGCRSTCPTALRVCRSISGEHEHEANSFALELLTPETTVDAFRARVPDLALCGELAMLAWVPIDYAAVRIAETSDRICAVVQSDHAGIRWVAISRRFALAFGKRHRLQEGEALDSRTLASRVLERGSPCEPALVPSESWLGFSGLPLLESSAPVARDGGVLTVLWARALETALLAPTSRLTH